MIDALPPESVAQSGAGPAGLAGAGPLFTCTWPKSKHLGPESVLYRDEVWSGIEYQVAAHLLYEGYPTEALAIVRGIHERYDGARHNPWNEIECGNHYARSLASWGVLLAFTGQQWDAPTRALSFHPADDSTALRALFTTGTGWGRVEIDDDTLTLRLDGGELILDELRLRGALIGTGIHLSAGDAHTVPLD